MKDKKEELIKRLTDKAMDSTSLETPSASFTENVMARIEAMGDASIFHYKPLIPNWMWGVLSILLLALIAIVMRFPTETGITWSFPELSLNFDNLSLQIPDTLLMGLFCLAIFLIIQVAVLKGFLDRRLKL